MRIISEMSKETKRLVDLFAGMSVGQELSFEQAGKIVGFKVASTLPSYSSARRIAVRDHSVVIEAVRGFGFKRIDGRTIAHDRSDRHLKGIRRKARTAAREVEVALSMNLTREDHLTASEKFNKFRLVGDVAAGVRSNRRQLQELASEPVDNRKVLSKL